MKAAVINPMNVYEYWDLLKILLIFKKLLTNGYKVIFKYLLIFIIFSETSMYKIHKSLTPDFTYWRIILRLLNFNRLIIINDFD